MKKTPALVQQQNNPHRGTSGGHAGSGRGVWTVLGVPHNNWPLCVCVLVLFAANECDQFGPVEVITGVGIFWPATVTCKLAWCPGTCTGSLYSPCLLLCTDWYAVVMHVYYPNGCFTDARLCCCHMYIFSVIPLYAFIVVCSSVNYCGPLCGRETFFIFTLGHKHIMRPLFSVLVM